MAAAKADRVINLSYYLGSDLPPHRATKLNIVGMDNCFEAARICGVKPRVFASSLAVSGQQKHFGDRAVTEDDYHYGDRAIRRRTRCSTNSRPRTTTRNTA